MNKPATPSEAKLPPKKEKSAVKNVKEKKAAKLKKSASGRSWSITGWITKKMYPDATEADIGEEMQAYFDEKLGVWVFPGEEDKAAEVAAGPPPPPTGPLESAAPAPSSAASGGPPGSASGGPPGSSSGGPGAGGAAGAADDPLAALMAPPPSSLRSSGSSARARYVDPFNPNPTPPSSQGSAPPPGSQGSSAPPMPKYAVFTPK
mmetsp:Transcript_24937/g.32397  ORF Transcript_24937/g.32397 Transcript_24937/m.32397 type:complete len:205 (-) Transcript_24937:316-930(-)